MIQSCLLSRAVVYKWYGLGQKMIKINNNNNNNGKVCMCGKSRECFSTKDNVIVI